MVRAPRPRAPAPHPGGHTVTGTDGAATGTASLAVTLIPTTTNVVAAPASFGGAMTVTATVVPAVPTGLKPNGSVTFSVDGTPVGSVTLSGTRNASASYTGFTPGPHNISAVYSGDNNFAGSTGTTTETFACAKTLTGPQGALMVSSGTVCLDHAQVKGSVTVLGTGSVSITNSTVSGEITDSRGGALAVCGTTVGINIVAVEASGFVLIGDPGDDYCAGNTVGLAIRVINNAHGVDVVGNRYGVSLAAVGNSGHGPYSADTAPEIANNSVR